MPSHRPISLSTHPSPPFRPNSPLPPFSTSPTFPTSASSSPERPQGQPFPEYDTGHPSSRLRTRVSSIRCAIARKQLLFGMNAKVNRDAVERRVEDLQRHDEEDGMRARLAAQRTPTPLQEQEEPESPSDEAMRFSKVDGNGMDDQGRETWDWHGLCIFVEEEDDATAK